jgi:excisionase family DNA binding protein
MVRLLPMEVAMPRRILRPKEAAQRLGVKHDKFYSLVREGKLRLVRLGPKCTGVEEADLDRFIENLPDARAAVSA